MENEVKTYNVKEVAEMLGTSEFTVRRKIQNGQLQATIDSKKQGYRISEDSLKNFAKSQESKIGSLWRKPTAVGGVIKTAGLVSILPALSSIFALPLMAGELDMSEGANSEHSNFSKINDTNVIDKMIDRLNIEIRDFDLQIKHLEFKIKNSRLDSEKIDNQEQLFQIQSQKLQVDREIKDLEIRKAFLESMQNKKDTEDR